MGLGLGWGWGWGWDGMGWDGTVTTRNMTDSILCCSSHPSSAGTNPCVLAWRNGSRRQGFGGEKGAKRP
jgi:hypothetical protein